MTEHDGYKVEKLGPPRTSITISDPAGLAKRATELADDEYIVIEEGDYWTDYSRLNYRRYKLNQRYGSQGLRFSTIKKDNTIKLVAKAA